MQEAPIDAQVICTDGLAGTTTALVFNPLTQALTHFVVQDPSGQTVIERLVPIDLVKSTSADSVYLNCTKAELQDQEVFSETFFYPNDASYIEYYEPYVTPLDVNYVIQEEDHIPQGELLIRRGASVEATDGYVGLVEAFLVNPENGHITHLVLEKRHLWGQQAVTLPVNVVDHVEGSSVFLKLSKDELATLPEIPIRHDWRDAGDVELVIWLFSGTEKAGEALDSIQKAGGLAEGIILNSAVLAKDEAGKTTLKETGDMDAGHGALYGAITGGIIGLLGGPVGAVVGAAAGAAAGGAAAHWIDMGFDDTNLRAMRDNLKPGTSVLVLLVNSDNAQEVLQDLEHLGGERVRQTLSQETLKKLNRQPDNTDQDEGKS